MMVPLLNIYMYIGKDLILFQIKYSLPFLWRKIFIYPSNKKDEGIILYYQNNEEELRQAVR